MNYIIKDLLLSFFKFTILSLILYFCFIYIIILRCFSAYIEQEVKTMPCSEMRPISVLKMILMQLHKKGK